MKPLQESSLMASRFAWCGLVAALICTAANAAPAPSHPDITGIWESIVYADKPDPAIVVPDPPPPQFTPQFATKYQSMTKLREGLDDPKGTGKVDPKSPAAQAVAERETSCLPYGMPYMMTGVYSLEILRAPSHFTIVAEAMLEVRRIYLNKKQSPLAEVDPGYEGHSVGHWEGDTLVVNTIGVKEDALISVPVAGFPQLLPHTPQMVIDERIHLLRPDVLRDEVVVTDPAALATPYRFTFTLLRLKNYETPEFVCDNVREKFDSDKGKFYLDTTHH